MVVKYRREDFRDSALGTPNRYVVRTRFGSLDPRRRLLMIYLGIGMLTVFALTYHLVWQRVAVETSSLLVGEGRVISKRIEAAETPDAKYWIRVEVDVQMNEDATPSTLADNVLLPRADWEQVTEGMKLGVKYRVEHAKRAIEIAGLAFEHVDE